MWWTRCMEQQSLGSTHSCWQASSLDGMMQCAVSIGRVTPKRWHWEHLLHLWSVRF